MTATVELLERHRDGDDQALNRLFEHYGARARMVVRSTIGRSLHGRTDIEGLVQRTFLHALADGDRDQPDPRRDRLPTSV